MGSDRSNFLIEALEPRILLSGQGLYKPLAILPEQADNPLLVAEEYKLDHYQGAAFDQINQYHPEEQLPDLFDGLEQADFPEPDAKVDQYENTTPLADDELATLANSPILSDSLSNPYHRSTRNR